MKKSFSVLLFIALYSCRQAPAPATEPVVPSVEEKPASLTLNLNPSPPKKRAHTVSYLIKDFRKLLADKDSSYLFMGPPWYLGLSSGELMLAASGSCSIRFGVSAVKDTLYAYWKGSVSSNTRPENRNLYGVCEYWARGNYPGIKSPRKGDLFAKCVFAGDTALLVDYIFKDWVRKKNAECKEDGWGDSIYSRKFTQERPGITYQVGNENN